MMYLSFWLVVDQNDTEGVVLDCIFLILFLGATGEFLIDLTTKYTYSIMEKTHAVTGSIYLLL